MLKEDFDNLKEGDQVIYTGDEGPNRSWPKNGTVITRRCGWLDDANNVRFTWDDEGLKWHFFAADEVEVIKGELA